MEIKILSSQLKPAKLSTIEKLLLKPELIIDFKNGRYLFSPGPDSTVTLKFSTIDKNLPSEKLTPKIASMIFGPISNELSKLSSKEGKVAYIVSNYNNILQTKGMDALNNYPHLSEFVSVEEDGKLYMDQNKVIDFVDSYILPLLEDVKGNPEEFITWLFREYVRGNLEGHSEEEIVDVLKKHSYISQHKTLSKNQLGEMPLDLQSVSFLELKNLLEEIEEEILPTAYYLDEFIRKKPDRVVVEKGKYRVIRFINTVEDIFTVSKLSGTHWCTGDPGAAREYLRDGNLYMFLKGNEPRLLASTFTSEFRNTQNVSVSYEELLEYKEVLNDLLEFLSKESSEDFDTFVGILKGYLNFDLEVIEKTIKATIDYLFDRAVQYNIEYNELLSNFSDHLEKALQSYTVSTFRAYKEEEDFHHYNLIASTDLILKLKDKLPDNLFELILLSHFPTFDGMRKSDLIALKGFNSEKYIEEILGKPSEKSKSSYEKISPYEGLETLIELYFTFASSPRQANTQMIKMVNVVIRMAKESVQAIKSFLEQNSDFPILSTEPKIPLILPKSGRGSEKLTFNYTILEDIVKEALDAFVLSPGYLVLATDVTLSRILEMISSKNITEVMIDYLDQHSSLEKTEDDIDISIRDGEIRIKFLRAEGFLFPSILDKILKKKNIRFNLDTEEFIFNVSDDNKARVRLNITSSYIRYFR